MVPLTLYKMAPESGDRLYVKPLGIISLSSYSFFIHKPLNKN